MKENNMNLFGINFDIAEITLDQLGRVVISNDELAEAVKESMPDYNDEYSEAFSRTNNGNCECAPLDDANNFDGLDFNAVDTNGNCKC